MSPPRILPLFDPKTSPGSWNERMHPGEYAVHNSALKVGSSSPTCTVFEGLSSAEDYSRAETIRDPTLRCRIYDHQGFIGAPLREFRGERFKGDSEITPRFRKWFGSFFFFGGLILTAIDWRVDFRLSWPAMIGTRMLIPGLVLLFTEAMVQLHARQDRRRAATR